MKTPTPVEIELASRVLSRRSLLPFVTRMNPQYLAGWVHADVCRRLEKFSRDVADKKSPRLMLLMPPRAGKSLLASQMFPAWHLGRFPDHEVIACSYNVSLAMSFSRKVKEILNDPVYQPVFDTRLDPENQSAEMWGIHGRKGGYVAAGVGGGITGRGAHILIVDDSLKNSEEADSAETREKLWDWYGSTAYTRLAPGGGVLNIQTCWHDDDLAGRLQNAMADPEADQFVIVRYPAISEFDEYLDYDTDLIVDTPPERGELKRLKGEALHPERYDLQKLNQIKRTISPRFWSALYQQNPVPDDGAYFLKENFRRGPIPHIDRANVYIAWDFAISEKKLNDYTVGTVMLQDEDDILHVAEVVRFKSGDSLFICDAILNLSKKWYSPTQQIGFEDGQIWRAIESLLKKRMRERLVYPSITVLKPISDKLARARPLQGRMQQGMVSFNSDASAEWYDACRTEMLRFPAGAHDDQCLVAGTMVSMADGSAKPIETVVVGDMVATPQGPRPVVASSMTNPAAWVFELALSNGVTLTGTYNHPVWSPGLRSFQNLCSLDLYSNLEYHETVSTRSREWQGFTPRALRASVSNWMERFTAATRSRLANTCATISHALVSSTTSLFGQSTTALSLQGTRFTTLTGIHGTTRSRTSNVCLSDSTSTLTRGAGREKSSASTWNAFAHSQKLGMHLQKAWLGIQKTVARLGKNASHTSWSASTAELSLSPSSLEQSSAPSRAETNSGCKTTLSITSRKLLGVRPVYNLTVADAHMYYANGILTHNCDALAWTTQLAIGRQPPAKIKQKPQPSWRDKLTHVGKGSFMSA